MARSKSGQLRRAAMGSKDSAAALVVLAGACGGLLVGLGTSAGALIVAGVAVDAGLRSIWLAAALLAPAIVVVRAIVLALVMVVVPPSVLVLALVTVVPTIVLAPKSFNRPSVRGGAL